MSTGRLITRGARRCVALPSLPYFHARLLVPLALLALPALCPGSEADELPPVVVTATRILTPVTEVASSISRSSSARDGTAKPCE